MVTVTYHINRIQIQYIRNLGRIHITYDVMYILIDTSTVSGISHIR